MVENWLLGVLASGLFFMISLGTALTRQDKRDQAITRAMAAALNWSDLLSPLDFERYCCEFLRLIGWQAETTKASGDQGADIIARRDSVSVVVQCKKYAKAVGNKAVQEVFAAKQFYRATAGAVVSNATYTRGATELAEATDIKLFHFTDLIRFNSTMIPGMADIDPARLMPGEIQPEANFRSIQKFFYLITVLSALAMAACIFGVIFSAGGSS